MRGQILNMEIVAEFVVEECCNCGTLFAMTAEFKKQRQRDKDQFYCPAGHGQHYIGKSDAAKVREAEARAREAEEHARIANAARVQADTDRKAAIAEANRLKRRAELGVCPHCKRSFVQLARHVKTKHPECVS